MSVALIDSWRTPGCGSTCYPRRHDPQTHELHGLRLALLLQRVPPVRVVRTGELVIGLGTRLVTVHGHRIDLPDREWSILAYLAERIGQNCPVHEMARSIWPNEPTVFGALNIANSTTYRLRRRLGESARLIVTLSSGPSCARRLECAEVAP